MEFVFTSSLLIIVFRWICIGFVGGFFFHSVQKQISPMSISLKAAEAMAVILSVAMLFLLIVGYIDTLFSLFSFGAGNIGYLLMRFLTQKLSAKKTILSSNTAMSSISVVGQKRQFLRDQFQKTQKKYLKVKKPTHPFPKYLVHPKVLQV